MGKEIITVIVLSYNHEAYLEESIMAVTAQTYPDIQLIVTDDFSKDGSADLIRKLAAQQNLETVINSRNEGLNATLSKALALAKGEYISIISADDFMLPQKVQQQFAFISKGGFDGVYANGYSLEGDIKREIILNPVFEQGDRKAILNFIYQYDWGAPLLQSGMFHKQIWQDATKLRSDFKSDDWAFLINAFQKFKIGFIREPLFVYRLHSDNSYKKYWTTFPMRIDVASRLVPEEHRCKSVANILFSQGQYLLSDKFYVKGLKFQLASLIVKPSFNNFVNMIKSVLVAIKHKF